MADRNGTSGFMRIISVPAGDTIRAMLAQPLVVEVDAPPNTPVVFRANIVTGPATGTLYSGVSFSSRPDAQNARATDTVPTDAARRATVYLRLGPVATEVVITAFAPSLNDSVRARILVRPGAPRQLIAEPSDTAVYVGSRYALRVSLVDTFGNPLALRDPTFTADSAAATVSSDGQIASRAIGRARVRVQAAQQVDTVWASVVPEGRIAAVRYAGSTDDSTNLVLVNLDGSRYRTFRLQRLDVPRPAWHPSGSYLVAAILPPPGASDPAARLARLDTATGVWRPVPGTGEAQGDGNPQFSRDGQWIYLSNASGRLFSSDAAAISRVRADGTGRAERVGYDRESATAFDHPTPSPDGARVAMTVFVSSGMYTLIVPATPPLGPPPGQFSLVQGLATGGHPRWSPVGEDVLMFGTEGMWLMRAGTRSTADRRYLAREWSNGSYVTGGFSGASWSPDGRWIVAKAYASLILVEVATGRVLPLPFGSRLADPEWRPR